MKPIQTNLFGSQRIDFADSVELTIKSINEYGHRYNHWCIAWSGGKDSTTLVTLVVTLIATGQVVAPKTLTVMYADTRMELTPLSISAYSLIGQLKQRGITVNVVMAPIDKRFLVYILGRGVPPPNNNTLRWCTRQIKIEPMKAALAELANEKREKILMLTGVRQGESAIRDGRIAMSCSRDGAECGQGWYQQTMPGELCDTLASILHWRVCLVWDWLKIYARMPKWGAWQTELLADAYGGDDAEDVNARTGCVGCPLASKDLALDNICTIPRYAYLKPLKELKPIYRWLRIPANRHRKSGEKNKDGSYSKNPNRLGPITLKARLIALDKIIDIQTRCNNMANQLGMPHVDILNKHEEARIRQLIEQGTYPDKWTGDEVTGDMLIETVYNDGSVQKLIF